MSQPDRTVGSLPSANQKPQSVQPDDPVEKAVTIMLLNDFSQLPVLDANCHAKGILRWPTILKGLLDSRPLGKASAWATEARTMHRGRSIYDAFDEVLNYEYVLVTEDHTKVCGIITAYDLGLFSHETLIPFMLIEGIELSLRRLVKDYQLDRRKQKENDDKPKATKDEREPSIGELVSIMRHQENWRQFGTRMTQTEVIGVVEKVRRYRNAIMHFNPQGASSDDGEPKLDMQSLKVIARFLGQIGLDGPKGKRAKEG